MECESNIYKKNKIACCKILKIKAQKCIHLYFNVESSQSNMIKHKEFYERKTVSELTI